MKSLFIILAITFSVQAFATQYSGTRVWLQERSDIEDLRELLNKGLEKNKVRVQYEGLTDSLKYQVCVEFMYDDNLRHREQEYAGKLPKLRNRYTYAMTLIKNGCEIEN